MKEKSLWPLRRRPVPGIGKIDMKPFDLQGDSALQRYAHVLDASDDYRVLRRLPRPDELWLMPTPAAGGDVVIGVIDVETTGLSDDAKVIELAMLKMTLVDGQLADITEPMSMFENPGEPLSAEIRSITGITDEDLRGQGFNEEILARAMGDVDVLVAFNAAFDAGHLTRRFPGMRHPWIDARTEFDWQAAGYEGRSQQALLTGFGHFYNAHRAASDVWALAMLIAMPAADGRTIAAHIVENGRRVDARVSAVSAPFAVKDELKSRGYRWNPRSRVWTIDILRCQVDAECAALRAISPTIPSVHCALSSRNPSTNSRHVGIGTTSFQKQVSMFRGSFGSSRDQASCTSGCKLRVEPVAITSSPSTKIRPARTQSIKWAPHTQHAALHRSWIVPSAGFRASLVKSQAIEPG